MSKPRILLSVAEMDEAFETMRTALAAYADITVVGLDGYSLSGADIFIGKKMSEEMLDGADRLRAVFAYKTGVDDFPVKEFSRRGILLVNSHINSRYIAQYAFGLAVALVSRIAEFDRKLRQGNWETEDPYWRSLFNMRVGLAGYGNIGREIHAILRANGIATYTLDRGKEYREIGTVRSLQELCAVSDLLVLSLPKTQATDKLFDEEIFRLLKGKYLVNVGRSNCIDEGALYAALSSGGMAGAAVDTWREKPSSPGQRLLPFDQPFQTLDNILLSSHKAMQLRDGHARYVADITRQVIGYLTDGRVDNVVDCTRGY